MNSDDEESSTDGAGRDGDSTGMDTDSDAESSTISFSPQSIYQEMVHDLQHGNMYQLVQTSSATLQVILENVDEFVQAIRSGPSSRVISLVQLGTGDEYDEKIELTRENLDNWNKLCVAFSTLKRVRKLGFGACTLSGEIMAGLVRALPTVSTIQVYLPWISLNDDMDSLIQALGNHSCNDIELHFHNETFQDEATHQAFLSSCVSNHFEHTTTISKMLRILGVSYVNFYDIRFSEDESKELGRLLTSGAVSESLCLSRCTFDGDGAQYVAHGLRDSPALVSLEFSNSVKQENFAAALVSSLPLSTSIQKLRLFRFDINPISPFGGGLCI